MIRRLVLLSLCFIVGAAITAAPCLLSGHFAHIDEAARGEETMGPGITTAFGLLAAPVGGVVAVLVALWLGKRKRRPSESSS